MSVPWRDKIGITHAWDTKHVPGQWDNDNHHAGWYTARAPCGASRRLRGCWDDKDRSRGAEVDCMACIAEETG
jgi:hypothetical protein